MWPFSRIKSLRQDLEQALADLRDAEAEAAAAVRNAWEWKTRGEQAEQDLRAWENRTERAIAEAAQAEFNGRAGIRLAGAAALGLHKKLTLARSLFVEEQEVLYQDELRKRGWNDDAGDLDGPKWGTRRFMIQSSQAHDPNAI